MEALKPELPISPSDQYLHLGLDLGPPALYDQLERLDLEMEHSRRLEDHTLAGEVLAEMGVIESRLGKLDRAQALLLRACVWNEILLATAKNLTLDRQYRLLMQNNANYGRLALLLGDDTKEVALNYRFNVLRLLDDAYTTYIGPRKGMSRRDLNRQRGLIAELTIMGLASGASVGDSILIAWPSWERQNRPHGTDNIIDGKKQAWDITVEHYSEGRVISEGHIQSKFAFKESRSNYDESITLICGDTHLGFVKGNVGKSVNALTSPYPTQTQEAYTEASRMNIIDDLKLMPVT